MGSLIGFFAYNWKLKLAAFALAMLLWITVTSDQVAVRWIPVPIQVEVRNPQFELLAGPEPDEVLVRFSGPRREFWDLALNRPPLHLALTEMSPGTNVYALDPQQVRIPRGRAVSALDLSPSTVRLTFQQVASREVPVRIPLAAGPGAEFALIGSPVAEPQTVTLSGPAERVAAIDSVTTAPLDLSAAEGDVRRAVPLDTSGLTGLTLSDREVTVTARIDRAVSQVIADVRVEAPAGVLVVPGTVNLQVWGAESVVGALQPAGVRVLVPPESIPARIPSAGVDVTLRVEQVPLGTRVAPEPRQVRVLPAPPPPAPEVPEAPAVEPPARQDTVPSAEPDGAR